MSSLMQRLSGKRNPRPSSATNNSRNHTTTSGPVKANTLYVVHTELADQSAPAKKQAEVSQLKAQIVDLETNLDINKEIIRSLLEGQSGEQGAALKALHRENQALTEQIKRMSTEQGAILSLKST